MKQHVNRTEKGPWIVPCADQMNAAGKGIRGRQGAYALFRGKVFSEQRASHDGKMDIRDGPHELCCDCEEKVVSFPCGHVRGHANNRGLCGYIQLGPQRRSRMNVSLFNFNAIMDDLNFGRGSALCDEGIGHGA